MARDTNMYSAEENAKKIEELENRVKRLEEIVFSNFRITTTYSNVPEPVLVLDKCEVYND